MYKNLTFQPIPYQGSKRSIAIDIMKYAPKNVGKFIEPFAGSAALSLFAAYNGYAKEYIINDSYSPIIQLWRLIVANPGIVSDGYAKLWEEQIEKPLDYYYKIREEFNTSADPIKLLYLLTRCVKNAVRFNSKGEFNQSPDKRRLGRKPKEMKEVLLKTSNIFKNKTLFFDKDFSEILEVATANDLVYMDPPYQGTSTNKNPRYHQGLENNKLIYALEQLNKKNVPFLLSYDGKCGDKKYGEELPEYLNLVRIDIQAGRSAQATLIGRTENTVESLYISSNLVDTEKLNLHPNLFNISLT